MVLGFFVEEVAEGVGADKAEDFVEDVGAVAAVGKAVKVLSFAVFGATGPVADSVDLVARGWATVAEADADDSVGGVVVEEFCVTWGLAGELVLAGAAVGAVPGVGEAGDALTVGGHVVDSGDAAPSSPGNTTA